MSNEINKTNTIVFLTGYIIAVFLFEIIILGFKHSLGLSGFLLLANAGIMLSLLYGYLTYEDKKNARR